MAKDPDSLHIIEGVEVRFPYPPYQSQKLYMEAVIKAVKNGKNALLESPTGTGKTLSLICSSLACLLNNKFNNKGGFNAPTDNANNNQYTLESSLLNKMSDLRKTPVSDQKKTKLRNRNRIHIVYASRTHTQLRQVLKEVRKSLYTNEFNSKGIKAVLLGSRDQLCINPARGNSSGEALNALCKNLVQNRKCIYHSGLKMGKVNEDMSFYELLDIEDMVSLGKSKKCCPYYAVKDAHESADLTLLPYNYLLSTTIREAMELNLQGAILIIDEAHNIESIAENAASFYIRQVDIARYMAALRRFASFHKTYLNSIKNEDKEPLHSINTSALSRLAISLKNIDEFLSNVVLDEYNDAIDSPTRHDDVGRCWFVKEIKRKHIIYNAQDIVTHMLDVLGFNELRLLKVDEIIRQSISMLSNGLLQTNQLDDSFISHYDNKTLQEDLQSLESLRIMLLRIFAKELLTCPQYFHVFITNDEKFDNSKRLTTTQPATSGWNSKIKNRQTIQYSNTKNDTHILPKILNFECLQAVPTFLRIKDEGVRSIILTSGTLAPLYVLEKQIGGNKLPFEIKLQNRHVIEPSRVWAGIVTGDKDDPHSLSSVYNTRATTPYVKALGESLLSFIKCVPSGVLVFFGSYPAMNQTVSMWKQLGLYSKMEMFKSIFIESRSSELNSAENYQELSKLDSSYGLTQAQIMEYKSHITSGKGSIFIGICRGKIAEGIDFSDDYCRGVFVCGIPYPNRYDDNTALKMDYLRRNGNCETESAKNDLAYDWYTTQAIRAINQAIGRSIRHINDYGAVLLADYRYQLSPIKQNISEWVANRLKIYQSIDDSTDSLKRFFKGATNASEPVSTTVKHYEQPSFTLDTTIKTLNSYEFLQFKSRKMFSGQKSKAMPLASQRMHMSDTLQRKESSNVNEKQDDSKHRNDENDVPSHLNGKDFTNWGTLNKWSYNGNIKPLKNSKY
ncbi:DNA repair helicase, putative [Theileria equi strain WA]|uniref:DNA repair helicase, putative n=1 Tax=Theileria equi strain WA TaxID=1537102 RepID=L0B3D0_THEEQ|nr:DNA repair helicase, putative [Theileria equi strain WA]AFZ81629.1 DNA repair helicase, putative [Theileria equi strain WA]|eukprot:XP_004831295.1 DNA repair helicase, putative [Theileria equi strain WA]